MKRLNIKTTHQICSNQVITSLSDSVKELLENSIDAKSDKIEIKLKNNGLDFIEVSDNGHGINESYLDEITKRHATTKIENFEDITNVVSFGYRGEALHSLCYNGDVEIITRYKSESKGIHVKFDNTCKIIYRKYVARNVGTTVQIRNLFKRLPVRWKYISNNLKQEWNKILNLINGYCVGSLNTSISCSLFNKNRYDLVVNGGGMTLDKNIASILGVEAIKSMFKIEIDVDDILNSDLLAETNISVDSKCPIKLQGYLHKPPSHFSCLTKSNSVRNQFIIINGRPNINKDLKNVICNYYKSLFKLEDNFNQRYKPGYIILLTVNSNDLDVNLEPDKTKVLFRQPELINLAFKTAILNAVERENLLKKIYTPINQANGASKRKIVYCDMDNSNSSMKQRKFHHNNTTENNELTVQFDLNKLKEVKEIESTRLDRPIQTLDDVLGGIKADMSSIQFHKEDFCQLEILGQFNRGFIITYLRTTGNLFIVDQHAADERYRLEWFYGHMDLKPQSLVIPNEVRVTPKEYVTIQDNLLQLQSMGYRINMGVDNPQNNSITISAVPSRRQDSLILDSDQDFIEIIGLLRDNGNKISSVTSSVVPQWLLPTKLRNTLASNACRSAIMVGTDLSEDKMIQVVRNLSELNNPWICAHGRPSVRHLGRIP